MTKPWLRLLVYLVFALALGGLLVACGDDDDSGEGPMVVVLTGSEEVPPVVTAGRGTSEITIDEVAMEITVVTTIEVIPADQLLFAHFHVAPAGSNGNIVANLWTAAPEEPFVVSVITPEDVQPSVEDGIENFDDLVQAIRDGNIYINVHTPAFLAGEIRGQTGG